MAEYLFVKRFKLLQAAAGLPAYCEAFTLFKAAYYYRRQYDFLGESGSEEDSSGLIFAVSRSLSLALDLELGGKKLYANSGRGIETVPWEFLNPSDSTNFKDEVLKAASKVPEYALDIFFDSLEQRRFDYLNQGKLQFALAESFCNYAKTATLGTIELGKDIPRRNKSARRKSMIQEKTFPEVAVLNELLI